MSLKKIEVKNFTVFENISIPFCSGLNVLVGENGIGKTYIMKIAYAIFRFFRNRNKFVEYGKL